MFYVRVKNHIGNKDEEKTRKFICYTLDSGVKLGNTNPDWDGKLVAIFNLKGEWSRNHA